VAGVYRFGAAELRAAERRLLIGGEPASIGARAFDLLLALIERRDRMVGKDELLDVCWPGLVVEENNLQVQVSTLRKLLGPQVIATISGRGYRFTADLSAEPAGDAQGEPPAPAHMPQRSLPAERDAFVGRDDALRELSRRFEQGARLVSLLGIGGCGKTRLAIHFGWARAADFPGGVWFCDLVPARTLEGVLHAVALGLDVPLGKDDPVAQLGNAIAGRGACLVILDNFEQAARHAEGTLGRWLDRAPDARFLVTSREVLGITGEEAQALAPLAPADAESLFLRRAAAAQRDFDPAPEDRAAIARLVQLLDGLPLAIELAAARVRTLAPRALLARMSERFRLLTSGSGRHDRQATLRAAFDWSWDLLGPADKLALAQCSVFEGGFTIEAAEAIIDLTSIPDAPWVVDVVQSLVDKSFVRPCGEGRFDLLVSVQAYAAEHLQTQGRYPGSGPAAQRVAERRHGDWFAVLGPKRAVENRCVELNNLVAACRREVAAGNAKAAAGALEGAWAALHQQGPFKAGVDVAEAVCAMPQLEGAAAALARTALADALEALGKPVQAAGAYGEAAAQAHAAGDRRCEAAAMIGLAALGARAGHSDEARAQYAHALELARQAGDADLECAALNGVGIIEFELGRIGEAQARYEEALVLARNTGDRLRQAKLLGNLGTVHLNLGRMDEAQANCEQSLQIARELGDRLLEGNTLCNLGLVHHLQRRHNEARAVSEAALKVARELGYARLECIVLCNLGLVHAAAGTLEQASSTYVDALAVARRIGDQRTEGQVLGYLGLVHARRRAFDEARQCLERGQALLVEADDRLSLGVLLCGRAEYEWRAGDKAAARAARRQAAELGAQAGSGPGSELGGALAEVDKLFGSPAA